MKRLEDLAKFPSENPNPVLRVTKNKVLYINKAGELLFSIKEGDKIPKLFQGELTEALNKSILKTLEVEIDNLSYILDIAPIKEEGYANIYGRNITDLKATENVLKESKKKLKDIIEAIPIGILISNPEGTITEINSQVLKIFGYDSKKDFLNIPALDHYYNPADRDLFIKMLESGLVKNFELKFKRKDGTIFWGSVTSIAKKIGNLTIYTDTFQDITEFKRAEQSLKESEAKWRAITEYSPDHILMMDKDAKILFINYTVPDLTVDEVLGRNYYDFVQEEFKEQQRKYYKEVMETGKPLLFETGYVDKEGNQFYFEVHSAPIWKEGKVVGIINRSNDITARKKRDEEVRLQGEIMTNMSEGVYLIRLEDLIIVYTNPRFEQMFGYDPGEMIGKYVVTVNAPTDKTPEETNNEIAAILKDQGEWHGEVLNAKKDGTPFWCYANASLFDHPEHGKVIVAVHTDITERKKAEQELKESEKKYRLLFENANDGISILDLEGNFYEVNDLYCTRLGYTREELLKSNIRDINVPEFADLVSDRIVDIKEKRFNVFESAHKTKDGRIIPVEISAKSFIYENKPAILSIVRDITDRKNAENEIVNLAKFPSENPFPVLRATKEKILYSNKAGEVLFKIKEGSRPPHKLLDWINQAIDLDTPQLIEIVFGEKTFLFNILSIKDEGYVNIYGRDITERKFVEIELQKSETTYREAYIRAEFYKDIFTHDINNILQNISNGIQLNEMYLNKPEKSNAIKRNIDIIKRQVKRGANLVSNVRKLSKISESEAFLFSVNCIEVLKKSINYIKNTFHDKNLKIDTQISEDIFKILANELLEDIFNNILTNSINYNDSEFINIEIKVTKELRQGINYIKMQFIDNGIGITDERKPQIFIRGYSEGTSIHGMGLGLSLVKKIIESYNGKIWMEDRVKDDYTKGNNCLILIPEVINNG